MGRTCPLALVTILALSCSTTSAVKVDAVRVNQGIVGMFDPSRSIAVRSAYVAADGTVWVFAVDWGYPGDNYRAPTWFARRFSSAGQPIPKDVNFSRILTRPGGLGDIIPLGTTPNGDLVIYWMNGATNPHAYIAKIRGGGTVGVSRPVQLIHDLGYDVDRDGIVHLLPNSLSEHYVQVDATSDSLPVTRTLDYRKPFGASATAPDYLRWSGASASRNGIAFYGEGKGKLVVSSLRNWRDSIYTVCRVNTKTLALLDSGHVDAKRDAFRAWSGPVLTKSFLVPAGTGGYWLFVPATESQKPATVVAYRLSPVLKVVHPTSASPGVAEPFASAPAGAVVTAEASYQSHDRWESDVWVVWSKLKLDFVGLGEDGQLYTQTLEESMASRVTE